MTLKRERSHLPRDNKRARAVAIVGSCMLLLTGCESETQIDPQQETNIQPGLRPEGSPRDEEN